MHVEQARFRNQVLISVTGWANLPSFDADEQDDRESVLRIFRAMRAERNLEYVIDARRLRSTPEFERFFGNEVARARELGIRVLLQSSTHRGQVPSPAVVADRMMTFVKEWAEPLGVIVTVILAVVWSLGYSGKFRAIPADESSTEVRASRNANPTSGPQPGAKVLIPDDLYHKSEALAQQQRLAVHQVIEHAVADYISRHADRLPSDVDGLSVPTSQRKASVGSGRRP